MPPKRRSRFFIVSLNNQFYICTTDQSTRSHQNSNSPHFYTSWPSPPESEPHASVPALRFAWNFLELSNARLDMYKKDLNLV
ncbi:hypothetical protein V5O48_015420 [Marasmius crinis-equi]|uniref:Uncharacterized protein n=1 Tax=Marasmius crinis-equi TaxID=585013 RepID=A0ABR3EUW4_9AGAR